MITEDKIRELYDKVLKDSKKLDTWEFIPRIDMGKADEIDSYVSLLEWILEISPNNEYYNNYQLKFSTEE